MVENRQEILEEIESVYRRESRRVLATLARKLWDIDLAEEALHEAFVAALEAWRRDGIPDNPRAWLVSTARFKAIDALRRKGRLSDSHAEVAKRLASVAETNLARRDEEIEDDRLRLIFTCCHPAIDRKVQIPLTLREVCGLTTEEIASAFLTSPTTMAQRLVRGKSKIRDAGIPFTIPERSELPERLEAVLAVIYLVFNEGYSASQGESHTRADLTAEAIRLARLVLELLPDPEVMGILALMLLHESRRGARTNAQGEIILLEDQDRRLWDHRLIAEGKALIERSFASQWIGAYTLQAAISAVHADAATAEATDWNRIVGLYDVLLRAAPSPVVELNRAVAVAKRDGPLAGLGIIEAILERGALGDYYLAHAARGELLRQLGRMAAARDSLEIALSLAKQEPERRFLLHKIETIDD